MSIRPQPNRRPHTLHPKRFLTFLPEARLPDCPLALQERTMHIHGNSMNINAANLYSAAQAERAAAAKRSKQVRKKLLKTAAGIDASASSEETLLIGQW